MKEVLIRAERCMSCHSCEVACAVAHSKSKNLISALGENPAPKKRISVEHNPELGFSVPVTCQQCKDAPCVSVCSTRALSQDPVSGIVSHNPDLCVDCWACSMSCSRFVSLYQLILALGCWTSSMAYNYGVIGRRTEGGVKCDLCQGRELPACVEACPTAALTYAEIQTFQG